MNDFISITQRVGRFVFKDEEFTQILMDVKKGIF